MNFAESFKMPAGIIHDHDVQSWAGNGHSKPLEWKMKTLSGTTDTGLIGIPNTEGCFSFCRLKDGSLGVAIYAETPNEIDKRSADGLGCGDAMFKAVDPIPGWGLLVIEEVEDFLR